MIVSWSLKDAVVVVVGSGKNAYRRVNLCLSENSSKIFWFCRSSADGGFDVGHLQLDAKKSDAIEILPISEFDPVRSLTTLGKEETDFLVDAVFVSESNHHEKEILHRTCKRYRIPLNIIDNPSLCSFTLPATWSEPPLQISLSTSSNGCRLAQRLLRHVVSSLPSGMPEAIERFGRVRAITKTPEKKQWINHVSDFWPLEKLVRMTEDDLLAIVSDNFSLPLSSSQSSSLANSYESLSATLDKPSLTLDPEAFPTHKRGSIALIGSGPGSPDLLTVAARKAIMKADYVLADKLVPEAVLQLIPRHTPLFIARKFPGNADKAQDELHQVALDALSRGDYVVRLKQGDPYIYGRGGEEYLFFTQHGYVPTVIPGISSALMAPISAGIPVTHRGVADQFLVCTGTGQKGSMPKIPSFVPTQTTVFLMALHRLEILVQALIESGWPRVLPVCIAERVSCPDQRFIFSTLEDVVEEYNKYESLPPGLLITGYSCNTLRNTA